MTEEHAEQSIVLEAKNIRKTFGNVVALDDVSICARQGEITAIIGDNGAGKSTLIKCISGVHQPDGGSIVFDGGEIALSSPEEARELGIETVHQDLALVGELTVWQNMFLNREKTKGFGPLRFLDRSGMVNRAKEMISDLKIGMPSVRNPVGSLSGGQRQGVAISRATGWGSKLIIMDEPTAALGVTESGKVEDLVSRLREEGMPILLISHNFEQVMRLSDQVFVLMQGRLTGTRRTKETTGEELVQMITGVVTE